MNKQDFLFEIGCEELPPKALNKLAAALHDNIQKSFQSLELHFESSQWLATPRRLAVIFSQLDVAQADKQVEKLGPAVAAAFDQAGQPKPAALGFAKSNGVTVEALSKKQTDKGERLAFIADEKGLPLAELIQDILQKAVSQLPIPKAMRWGDSNVQFSRPVHWLVAILGEQTLPVELFELSASNVTYGHRFHAPQAISLSSPSQYIEQLLSAKVVVDCEMRKQQIKQQVETAAASVNATAVIDKDLLDEVAALVEWPVALVGNFDQEFLSVPAEALISSMAEHQKYFHLVDQKNELLPKFIAITNIESNNPESVITGNEKVIRPRLADAKFFFDTDKKRQLASYSEKLKSIVFQNKLGSLFDKTQRIKSLANTIANKLAADQALVSRAADLCKCDLMTDMVYEFPDLQGIMGKYYALNDGEPAEVAEAMNEIYMPRFAGDELPQTKTGLVLALAERIDTLVGIFSIGQIPTGAKDPFALRRASLGVLRLITEKNLDLDLAELIDASLACMSHADQDPKTKALLLEFFAARELAMYQAAAIPTQVIAAVQALNITQPTDFANRIKAVNAFNQTAESADLAEANKRVKNILQKSDSKVSDQVDESLFEAEEKALYSTINQVKGTVNQDVASGNYQQALTQLAGLKDVVNQFFDNVMINADDPTIKNNRLALISQLRALFLDIADISLLQK
ncbi:glycine--tRNA ligase subunit beta [Aliikangiella sp. IMCC44653]